MSDIKISLNYLASLILGAICAVGIHFHFQISDLIIATDRNTIAIQQQTESVSNLNMALRIGENTLLDRINDNELRIVVIETKVDSKK